MLLTYIVIAFEGILVFDTEVPSGLVPQFQLLSLTLEESFGELEANPEVGESDALHAWQYVSIHW